MHLIRSLSIDIPSCSYHDINISGELSTEHCQRDFVRLVIQPNVSIGVMTLPDVLILSLKRNSFIVFVIRSVGFILKKNLPFIKEINMMATDLPLVSIVIPTFNQAQYLPACVDHCMFQTYPNLEIIIVDGGSTDGTKAYLSSLKDRISQLIFAPIKEMDASGNIIREERQVYPSGRTMRILTFDEDIGATRTYNEGLSRVNGLYCTYIVGDDLPLPHMVEDLVAALERTGADFVYSDMNLIDDDSQIIRQVRLPDYSFEDCFVKWYHIGVSHLYRTLWHEKVGLMDDAYRSANDYDHYLRFAMANASFYHVAKILYAVRYHGKGRKTGQHTKLCHINLIEESKRCSHRARKWLREL
ncbi:MAG: glycosyltransferase [Desulfobacula sp.]|jgi:glycosyltransferase involved in cell wall biosynthesis|nr:glycosyltransferase [Desulfobacula sp.]